MLTQPLPAPKLLDRVRGTRKSFAHVPARATNEWMFYVYVLQSARDSGLYIGYSTDLKRRLRQHLRGAALATS